MNSLSAPGRKQRKPLVFAGVAMLLAAIAWYVNSYVSLQDLIAHEIRVRDYIARYPFQAFVVGFGIYAGLSLVPGTGGKAIVYGWLFGFWQALAIVTVGLTLGAMSIFFVSRYLFQEAIERRYTNFVALMNKHLEKEGAYYLLALRMAHVPYSIVNPVSGASRIGSGTFCWTTAVGLLPANIIWTYVGVRLPSLRELASSGPGSLLDLPLISAMVACAALPHLVRWLIGRFGVPAAETRIEDSTEHES